MYVCVCVCVRLVCAGVCFVCKCVGCLFPYAHEYVVLSFTHTKIPIQQQTRKKIHMSPGNSQQAPTRAATFTSSPVLLLLLLLLLFLLLLYSEPNCRIDTMNVPGFSNVMV